MRWSQQKDAAFRRKKTQSSCEKADYACNCDCELKNRYSLNSYDEILLNEIFGVFRNRGGRYESSIGRLQARFIEKEKSQNIFLTRREGKICDCGLLYHKHKS